MKTILLLFAVQLFVLKCLSQPYPGKIDSALLPPASMHYLPEYTFDVSVNIDSWLKVNKGLNISFASTDQLYMRTEVPDVKSSSTWSATGWKGERLNAELLIWSADTINQLQIKVSDLKTGKSTINKKHINSYLVRYVLSNHPYNDSNVSCESSPFKDGFLMPDRFEDFERFDLPGKTVRPIWISIDIPSNAVAGNYTGTIEVLNGNKPEVLSLNVTVQKQTLPPPVQWKHRLDLWQNPWVVAEYYHVKPWSKDHLLLLKKHLQPYADAGGSYITTYAVHSPWSDVSYYTESGMIEWIHRKDGKWIFDYSIFDTYVDLCMEMGINKAITLYTPVPWGNRFRYLNEESGNYEEVFYAPDTKEYKELWNAFLTSLKAHLLKRGWFNKAYLGINENEMNQTLAAIKVIKDHSKDWKITYAGDWHTELDSLLDDYSYLFGKEPTLEQEKTRSARGATSTYYVCCNPPKPNTFVFSPPIEGRWLSWYTAAYGYDGFLRWAYDAWSADPLRDPRHIGWGAGDCMLVYPGGNSCIRFEKLREGIVDYEKIRILKELAAKSNDNHVKEMILQLDQHLKIFTTEKSFNTKK